MFAEITSASRLIEIGIALSSEKDIDVLMEKILLEAMDLTNADGGTLYVNDDMGGLEFEIVRTVSLGIAQGGTTNTEVTLPPVKLLDAAGKPNLNNINSYKRYFISKSSIYCKIHIFS